MKNDTLKQTLSAISKTVKLASDLRKSSSTSIIPQSGEDIYLYFFHLDNLETGIHKLYHGDCFEEASVSLLSSGYSFRVDAHYPTSNKLLARTTCSHCSLSLDPAEASIISSRNADKIVQRKRSYDAYIEEQILLGLL